MQPDQKQNQNIVLDRIYRDYRDHIFAIGFNYFGNPADADDVVQEVFCRLGKSRPDFESEAHIRNWLIRVAVNECKRISLSPWRTRRRSSATKCASPRTTWI